MASAKSFSVTNTTLALAISMAIISILSIFFIKHNLVTSSYDSESIISFVGQYQKYPLVFTIKPNIGLEFSNAQQAEVIINSISRSAPIKIKVNHLKPLDSPIFGMRGYRAELIEASID
ncbi:hypothetical protein ISS86_01880 [Candidatus Microgenomates bacterium]|nr:hypothetical protein [Candidatus Microgenomates bacterium]